MLLVAVILALLPCSVRLSAQGLSTSRVESSANAPLVIAQRAPAGMPIRILAGAGGLTRALEIDGTGGTWLRGPVSIGALTGAAPLEVMRLSTIAATDGKGMVVSLNGCSTSSGVVIADIGMTGSDHAGMMLSSAANGVGTGLRIGGPSGANRPTLATGIDITGGVGMRYNALSSGTGTALDIGGSVPPRRGMEVVAAGSDHIGVIAHANTLGVGLVGSSRSLSYPTVGPFARVGVVGHSATNSAVSMDSSTGMLGMGLRGGTSGASTVTIGVHGIGDLRSGSSTGMAVGVLGRALQNDNSGGLLIGGLLRSSASGYAIVADGDVYLGGASDERPSDLSRPSLALQSAAPTTHVFNLRVTGMHQLRAISIVPSNVTINITAAGSVVDCGDRSAQRITGPLGARIIGITPVGNGRLVQLCNIGTQDMVLVHDDQTAPMQTRLQLTREVDGVLPSSSCMWLWYDDEVDRWRHIQ